jgi:glycosyltransferase involved in cell wall biosynthesis
VRAAVDSVLNQTFSDFEFLIFDDGSTDSTGSVLRDAASRDGRIRLFQRQHQGYSPLLNEGLLAAKGEFIARMDADDISAPTRFEKQVAYLRENPGCVAVGSGLVFIDEAGRPFARNRGVSGHAQIDALHLRGGGGTMPHPSLMFRKSALDAIGGYRTQFEPAEDLDLLLRLGEIGQLENLPEQLLKYRVHSKMTSATRRQQQMHAHEQILTEALGRRGLPLSCMPEPLRGRRQSDDSPLRRRGRAVNAGYYSTAQRYALKVCLSQPWQLSQWVSLAKVVYARLRFGDHADPNWQGSDAT